MSTRWTKRERRQQLHYARFYPPRDLFLMWQIAAEEWKRLRSDPAARRCLLARAAWYTAVWGEVPPLPARGEVTA